MKREYSALALFSGGLDSVLSVKYMQKLGYRVIPIFFKTPFFGPRKAIEAAKQAGIRVEVIDLTDEHLEMMKNPKYGFGKSLNPCIDCHGIMFRKAGELLKQYNAHFLISGEVLGQRPMSQRADAMNAVKKISGVADLIVRPLCQKLISDTLPVREGWVNKDELLDFQGRGRKRQMELAAELGIEEYSNPGGGCLLTETGLKSKLADLRDNNMLDPINASFLRLGRHFRINENMKLIVGKTSRDIKIIADMVTTQPVLKVPNMRGPIGVIFHLGIVSPAEIELAARIVLYFTSKEVKSAEVRYGQNYALNNSITVENVNEDFINKYKL